MAERLEDLNLPASVVTRLIKLYLPDGVNVSKDARVAVARASSMFVLYLTSSSNNILKMSNRKTISANDVFNAIAETEVAYFLPRLKDTFEAHKKVLLNKKLKAASEKSQEDKEVNEEDNSIVNNSVIDLDADEDQEE